MSTAQNTILPVLLTFLITFGLNTAINYYSSDKGSIGISRPIQVGGKSLTVLTIENYSRDFMNEVAIEIPSALSISELLTDAPVIFTDTPQPYQGRSRVVKLGQISPRLVTRVFIPLPDAASHDLIRVANPDASGLSLRKDDEIESPLRKAALLALLVAVLYAIFTFLSDYYTKQRINSFRLEIENLRKKNDKERAEDKTEADELGRNITKTREQATETKEMLSKQVTEAREMISKQRLLLQARLFDYAKELEFWRNAFRTLILNKSGSAHNADELIKSVTDELKTHGTKASTHQFETIRIAAEWLADAERKSAAPAISKATTQ